VTRYLLDTNIISNVVKPQPSESLLSWMSMQRDEDLFIASLTVATHSTTGSPGLKDPRRSLRAVYYHSTTRLG
jgi:hypothetical protein